MTELQRIKRNIRTILLTSRGEVPFRPAFGLGAETFLGGGMKDIDLIFEVADQLTTYEPRIKLDKVTPLRLPEGRIQITIEYSVKNQKQTLTI